MRFVRLRVCESQKVCQYLHSFCSGTPLVCVRVKRYYVIALLQPALLQTNNYLLLYDADKVTSSWEWLTWALMYCDKADDVESSQ